ncbi:MAG: hypothetical protein KDA75_11640 [Planctomycetaceae bacterium]|nr:hypothetical protein [Planctomycetaceae bacterium]
MTDAVPQSGPEPLPDASLLRSAAALFGGWCLFLTALAVWTSNPVQLNYAQLGRATTIVEARVVDLSRGECSPSRQWTPGAVPQPFVISNLAATRAAVGESYIFPLVRDLASAADEFRVVDVPDRHVPPLVYPAGPEAEAALLAWQGRTE